MPKGPVTSVITGLPRPHWRGRIHTYAFFLTVPAAFWLLLWAEQPTGRIGALVFGASLAAVYGVSAAYHRLAHSPKAQHIMRRLDHSMIFLLIAGTYTPVCVVLLPRNWSLFLLSSVWGLTVLGIVTKVWGTDWIVRVSNALYPVLGWLAVLALPVLLRSVPGPSLALLVLGGMLYTVGALVFLFRRPDPNPAVFGYHEVWHSFTVLAGASHFAMVALIVR